MTKKKKIILVSSILLVLILGAIGGSVFAKYQSQTKGQGYADIARWSFVVDENSSAIKTFNINNSYDENTLVNGKIAPGTKGSFDITVDATKSEVGIDYTVTFANEQNKPTNLKFKYEGEEYNSLQALENKLTGTIDANATSKKITLTIEWFWDYETGDENTISSNDITDTKEGIKNLNYIFDVIVTGTQVSIK